jgi:hypothetical protein
MTIWQYTKGLHDLGNDIYAYLQPDGTWGWSNAGLITDGEASLLIDTLFDLRLTGEMLGTMRRSLPAAAYIQEHPSDAATTHLRGRIDRVCGQQNGASDRSGTGTDARRYTGAYPRRPRGIHRRASHHVGGPTGN